MYCIPHHGIKFFLDLYCKSQYIPAMNKLSTEKRARVVAALVERNPIRATARMTGASKPTILKLLADLGVACERFHDETVRGVNARRVQADEVWSFCYAKAANVPQSKRD